MKQRTAEDIVGWFLITVAAVLGAIMLLIPVGFAYLLYAAATWLLNH